MYEFIWNVGIFLVYLWWSYFIISQLLIIQNIAISHSQQIKVVFFGHLQNDIRKNPTFRSQFHEMCAKVGVDPLASNKGFWAELLGIGDFYYELG